MRSHCPLLPFSLSSAAVLVAAMPLVAPPQCARAEELAREFFYATDGESEILTASWTGPMVYLTTLHLYGDGRLHVTYTSHTGVLVGENTTHLRRDEIDGLLAPLVEAGVMEFDYRAKQEELRGERRVWPIVADGATLHLLLNLDHYRGPGNPDGGPVGHSVAVHALRGAARYNPDIPELVALAEMNSKLSELRERAKTEAADNRP